jgi:hypothetical protein
LLTEVNRNLDFGLFRIIFAIAAGSRGWPSSPCCLFLRKSGFRDGRTGKTVSILEKTVLTFVKSVPDSRKNLPASGCRVPGREVFIRIFLRRSQFSQRQESLFFYKKSYVKGLPGG